MPLIERYILRRTAHIFFMTLGALVATLWVTQVLRQLDVVTAKGQAIWVFLLLTVLTLPALAQVVAPVAFLVATIVTFNNLTNDSELPVISAAGASRAAVARPIIVLGVVVMLVTALSYHVLAPASYSAFREILTRVRADVIASLVQGGGFREVDSGLTMHIREKAPDGSFRDIFVDDARDAKESLQYTASRGVLLDGAQGSYLVLQDGDLIREDHETGNTNVVAFQTYALDLSQIGPRGNTVYEANDRSTLYLLNPEPDDPYSNKHPQRVQAEIHSRITAPLYTLVFAFITLAFLGRPRTNRQDRSLAIVATVLLCLAFRVSGFGAVSVARNTEAAIPFLYVIPIAGIVFGLVATLRDARLRMPRFAERAWDGLGRLAQRLMRRPAAAAGGGAS